MFHRYRALPGTLGAVLVAACAHAGALAPVAPARADADVRAAQAEFARSPSDAARLALGTALYHAGSDSAARATLAPLVGRADRVGTDATLVDAAAAEHMGDLEAARRGYTTVLARRDDAAARARLGALGRREADAAARAAIARESSLSGAQLPARSVGVAPLAVLASDSALAPLGYGLADLLITDLSRSAQLQVVDRVQVDALLRELNLARSGRVDAATAPRLGRLVGARRLVNGALTGSASGAITVDARIADAAQGALVGSAITEQTRLGQILDSEKALAFQLFDALGVTLTPAERRAVEQRPTRYLSAFLAYSNGVRAEAQGNLALARAYYQRALVIDPGFALARQHLEGVAGDGTGPEVQLAGVPGGALSGVIDALNPSPAGQLGVLRDPGNFSDIATFGSGQLGTIIIQIFTP